MHSEAPHSSVQQGLPAQEIGIPASDGYRLQGHFWPAAESAQPVIARPVVVVNPATSVAARYYHRFARFLQQQGLDVLTYDYRGIGLSRPARLRGFEAGWRIWGERDFEGVLQWLQHRRPGQPVDVVGHSAGGFVAGLAESAPRLHRVCTVAAQLGYWADFAAPRRLRMAVKWQLAMPLLSALLGYFPGQRLGWLEDTPRGVVQDWTQHMRRLEQAWDHGGPAARLAERTALVARCARLQAPMLAIGLEDDAFGTVPALERLLGYYPHSPRTHIRVAPRAVGAEAIGHFAFFHSRFAHSLWPLVLAWLQTGHLQGPAAHNVPFTVVQRQQPPARQTPSPSLAHERHSP